VQERLARLAFLSAPAKTVSFDGLENVPAALDCNFYSFNAWHIISVKTERYLSASF